MTDSDKLKAITDALLGIVSIINAKDSEQVEVEAEKVKKKAGRPKKVVVEPIEESKDIHTIVKKPSTSKNEKGSLTQMEIRTTPMKFLDNGPPPEKIDKKATYINKAQRTKRKKPYEATLVDCTCNTCGKTVKVDRIFAPKKFDSEDEGGLFTCDKCIKRKGF